MNNQIFQYNGSAITFLLGNGDVMISATEMARPFDKQPAHWLSNQSTKDFITELSVIRNLITTDLVKIMQGGNIQGTWFHEDVALEFARWLSPSFAIWCNDRIKELLRHGMTATPQTLEYMLDNPDVIIGLATQLKAERAEKEQLQEQNRLQTQQIQLSAPKAQYYDTVLMSESTYNTNQIAKELGMSAVTLNKLLQTKKIHYRQGGQWLLYSKYQDKGYIKTRTYTFIRKDETQGSTINTVWTEKGRLFIHETLM